MIPALIVATLIVLNGLFVAAEFAIVGCSRARIDQAERRGKRLARFVQRVLKTARSQDRYIATAQLGITSASLALGMYGEHLLAEWLALRLEGLGATTRWLGAHAIASVLAVTFLTYLHVVLGEMVPKSLALQAPSRVAMAVAVPMRGIELASYPLVVGLNGLGNGILRLFGIARTADKQRYRTADELSFIVAESRAGGLLERESARVIQELLEFGQRTAKEVMVPRTRVVSLALGSSREEVAAVLHRDRHTRYPIHKGDLDRIMGVVHVKDLLGGLGESGVLDRSRVREVPFVPTTEPLENVLAVLRSTRSHMAIVIDEHGGTAGVLTLEDLFEEVVGDIADPGETPRIRKDDGGRLSVAGTVRLDELGEALGLVLEHEEVDTISGLVLANLGRPPEIGDRVEHENVVLEVSAIRGKGVEEARIVSAPDPE